MSHTITVVYAFDQNYVRYAAVSTFSLALNSRSVLQIYWLIPDTDASSVEPIAADITAKTGIAIKIIPVSMDEFGTWKQSLHYTQAMYLRLLIPSLIRESRVIYLDADTLVLSDLGELHAQELGDALIAGVPDPGAGSVSAISLRDGDPYLNSGVLLMNLDALRHDGVLDKVRVIYAEHEQLLVWPDQCVINKYAEGRKLAVHTGWNRRISAFNVTEAQFESVLAEANLSIMHFIDSVKPWHAWCNPRVAEFWWDFADRAQVNGLVPQEITKIDQAILYANLLDRYERYRDASEVKGKIIDRLSEILNERENDAV
jgi:lipopolysaccharide biosynthesis glycosyltransferase